MSDENQNDNVIQVGDTVKLGITEAERQREAVRKKYENTDSWMKAPNGKPTNLTEEQWVAVRTPNFKRWFGNWDYDENKTVKITNLDTQNLPFDYKDSKSVKEWLSENLTGKQVSIASDGMLVGFTNRGLKDSLKRRGEEQRAVYIKLEEVIKNAAFFDFEDADGQKKHSYLKGQDIYYSAIKIENDFYSVKLKLDVNKSSLNSYYKDHKVAEIKIAPIVIQTEAHERTSSQKGAEMVSAVSPAAPEKSVTGTDVSLSDTYITISQLTDGVKPGFSQVIDENGEPLVVYHTTDKEFDVFDLSQARTQSDVQAFFFSSGKQDWQDMGKNVMGTFLNIRNPTEKPLVNQRENDAGIKARQNLIQQGFDGTIEKEEGMETEYAVFNSNQIKSATDNNGNFDINNESILFQTASHKSSVNFEQMKTETEFTVLDSQENTMPDNNIETSSLMDDNQKARIQLAHELKENMPMLTEGERAAAIAICEAGAASMGMELSEYINSTFPNGVFGNIDKAKAAAHQQGVEINGAVTTSVFGDSVRATIYASRTADFSTWCHELAHVWQAQLTGKLKNDAENAFQVKDGDWQHSVYTFSDGSQDTSAEAFAYGFEDFLKHKAGEMATEDKKAVFERFADYMSRTYNGIGENITISEEIAKVYNSFVHLDDNVLAQAEKAVQMEKTYGKELADKVKNKQILTLEEAQRLYPNIVDLSEEFSNPAPTESEVLERLRSMVGKPYVTATEGKRIAIWNNRNKNEHVFKGDTYKRDFKQKKILNRKLAYNAEKLIHNAVFTEAELAMSDKQKDYLLGMHNYEVPVFVNGHGFLVRLEGEVIKNASDFSHENKARTKNTYIESNSNTNDLLLKLQVAKVSNLYTVRKQRTLFQLIGERSILRMTESEEKQRMLDDLRTAKLLDEKYRNMDQEVKASRIRFATGWEKAADGRWKYELDDSISRIKSGSLIEKMLSTSPDMLAELSNRTQLVLGDVLDSPELFKVFPFMQNVNISFYSDPNAFRAVLTPEGIKLNTTYLNAADGEKGLKGVLAHEIQHVIQAIEYADSKGIQGKDIEQLYKDMMETMKAAESKQYDYDITSLKQGLDSYMRDMGEVEARNVARRITMSYDERRHKTLESTEDVPRNLQFQIIGKHGASNLDAAQETKFRMDNLSVAEEMEKNERDEKNIRIATGWERGLDGQWRYEIDDSNIKISDHYYPEQYFYNKYPRLKELEDKLVKDITAYDSFTEQEKADYDYYSEQLSKLIRSHINFENGKEIWTEPALLEDVVYSPELFKAYPELAKTKFIVKDLEPGLMGQYDGTTITLDTYAPKSTLLHEIQHVIQDIEGFARGGSDKQFKIISLEELDEKRRNLNNQMSDVISKYIPLEDFVAFDKELLERKSGEEYKKEKIDFISKYDNGEFRKLAEEMDSLLERIDEIKENALDGSVEVGGNVYANEFIAYKSIAGEVEARNVQERMNYNQEKRQKTLLSETEDVSRDEQIINLDEDAVAESKRNGPEWLKTPFGKPTELSEEEWYLAHTNDFKEKYGDWELKIKRDFLLSDNTVSTLTGDEFQKQENMSLTDQVEAYFNSIGNYVQSPFFGSVVLDRQGADDSLAHWMTRQKAVAYAGVKDVIEKGVILESDYNHKGRGYNSHIIAAPIKIGNENYICEVVLKQSKNETRFYLHEVTEQKKFRERAFLTNLAQKPAHPGTLNKVLENTVFVNTTITCPLTLKGEPEKEFMEKEIINLKTSKSIDISNIINTQGEQSMAKHDLKVMNRSESNYFNSDEVSFREYSVKIDDQLFKEILPERYSETNLEQNEIACIDIRISTNPDVPDQFLISKYKENDFDSPKMQVAVELKDKEFERALKKTAEAYEKDYNARNTSHSFAEELIRRKQDITKGGVYVKGSHSWSQEETEEKLSEHLLRQNKLLEKQLLEARKQIADKDRIISAKDKIISDKDIEIDSLKKARTSAVTVKVPQYDDKGNIVKDKTGKILTATLNCSLGTDAALGKLAKRCTDQEYKIRQLEQQLSFYKANSISQKSRSDDSGVGY